MVLIRQRQVRRSKFQSRFGTASLKRREHTATIYSTAIIQLFLSVFLMLGAYRSFIMMRQQFPEALWYLKYALPFMMSVVSLVVLRLFVANVVRAINVYRRPPDTTKY